MKNWTTVINAALLGTDKKPLQPEEFDEMLRQPIVAIQQVAAGREEAFLQSAALVYNYRQCGALPARKEKAAVDPAAGEVQPYVAAKAQQVLRLTLDNGAVALLSLWLDGAVKRGQIVPPEWIPALFEQAVKHPSLQEKILTVTGNRGSWLQQWNPGWKFDSQEEPAEEQWHTGALPARKAYLLWLRNKDAGKARELLQAAWPQEPLAARLELLQQLSAGAGENDLPWLETLLNEKSVKLREAALSLMKIIPASSVVASYWDVLVRSVQLTQQRSLLGLQKTKALNITLAPADPLVFKTGIDQVAPDKKTSDELYLLYQLFCAVPPQWWSDHLAADRQTVMDLFARADNGNWYIEGIALAAIRFSQPAWLQAAIDKSPRMFLPEAIGLLPQPDAEKYAARFLTPSYEMGRILDEADHFTNEWSEEFASATLTFAHTASIPAIKRFFGAHADKLPLSLLETIDKKLPKEEENPGYLGQQLTP
ncbi:MAG: DUF5691 domain-containing protein, partial [Flavihumibacter sp.]